MTGDDVERLERLDQEVLAQRAARLAAPLFQEEDKADTQSLLVFSAMQRQFAVAMHYVEAVAPIVDIIAVPQVPAHIVGVMRRRGRTYALVNVRRFFWPNVEGLVDEDYAVVVQVKGRHFALQVEDVDGVRAFETNRFYSVPANFDPQMAPHVRAVTDDGVIQIDLDAVLLSPGFGTTAIEE